METKENVAMDDIQYKMRTAYSVALSSDDKSTKNGAILVNQGWNVLTGWNHMMEGWGGEDWHHERPFKYWITEHAERDVILKAARKGIKTKGLTMVANWVACPDCARAIVGAGIKQVITHGNCQDRTPPRWTTEVQAGLDILAKGGVQVDIWYGEIGDCGNLNGGEVWYP